jgi:hypothetical protein
MPTVNSDDLAIGDWLNGKRITGEAATKKRRTDAGKAQVRSP